MAKIRIVGDSSGYVEIAASNAAGNNTLELPSGNTRLVGSDSAGNVSVSGIVTAASFSGNVTGNVNSSGVTTVTTLKATSIVGVSSVGVTTAYVTSINEGQLQGYRNMLYNGAMVVNQRGYTSTASTSTGYSVDRWNYNGSSQNDAVVAVGQSTSASAQPTGQGFTNSLHLRVTTADSSLSANQFAIIQQNLEGYDVQRIKKGSSNAEPVTLSFWVRSSKTGTYIVDLHDNDNTRQVARSYTIDVANTWEKKIITFPADTTGAFDNDNALSLYINWWLAAGSTWTSGTLNTSWASLVNANRAVGQVNFLDTAGAQFNLTGCQLEVGPNATDFEFRSYGDELRMCQRYFERIGTPSGITPYVSTGWIYYNNGSFNFQIPFRTTKRTSATITSSATSNTLLQCYGTQLSSGTFPFSGTATLTGTTYNFEYYQPLSSNAAGGGGTAVGVYIRDGQYFDASAEL